MPEIKIVDIGGGIEFEVIAKPKSRKEGIAGVHDGALRIAITAAPEKGRANDAIVKVLSELLNVPTKAITIVSGQTSRRKRIRIDGVEADALLAVAGGNEK